MEAFSAPSRISDVVAGPCFELSGRRWSRQPTIEPVRLILVHAGSLHSTARLTHRAAFQNIL